MYICPIPDKSPMMRKCAQKSELCSSFFPCTSISFVLPCRSVAVS